MKGNLTMNEIRHWWRLLPESGEFVSVRECERLMRQIAELDMKRAALIAELHEENAAVADLAMRNWTPEETAAVVDCWDAPPYWPEVLEFEPADDPTCSCMK